MADALEETKIKRNKFHDLYDTYDEKIKTLQKEIQQIKDKYRDDPLTMEVELKKLSRYTYNNVPLDKVYNDLIIKQNYIVNALTSPYIKTRGHRIGETINMLANQLPSHGLYGLLNNQKFLENNPLTQTDAENQEGVSIGLWDYAKRTFFPHIAPRFSNSDGNGLYKVNEYYDGDFEKRELLSSNNPWYKPFVDQNVDPWGRDYDHEFFGIAPENIVDSASDETVLNTLNGDNINIKEPIVEVKKDNSSVTDVIKKKGENLSQNKNLEAGAFTEEVKGGDGTPVESTNDIPNRIAMMSKSIKENPSSIQDRLMEDPRWTSDRLAKLRIKDQDFQKAKGSKDLMIEFNKNKASGVYS
tara:strand:+ start:89 stop:1156 length:1068 start_codon:yes stop_codon:yes gene_type:complete